MAIIQVNFWGEFQKERKNEIEWDQDCEISIFCY